MSEPIFFLELSGDGVYEPEYVPPTLKDGCERLENLHKPKAQRAKVRIDGVILVTNVLVSRYTGDLWLTATEWRRHGVKRAKK